MIDWDNIDTVLLDMDGTLLDLHFDSHFWLEHLPRRYVELHHLGEATQETLRSQNPREGQPQLVQPGLLEPRARCRHPGAQA